QVLGPDLKCSESRRRLPAGPGRGKERAVLGAGKTKFEQIVVGHDRLPRFTKIGLCPRNLRCERQRGSARYEMQTISAGKFHFQATSRFTSLDHLVGKQLQCVGHLDAEQSRRLRIDDELEFGRLHDRQVSRLRSFEDLTSVNADLTKHVQYIGSITRQPPTSMNSRRK